MRDESPEKIKALRTGFTTGACATATSLAAAKLLLLGDDSDSVEIELPRGEKVSFVLKYCRALPKLAANKLPQAIAATIKDAGDDPDVTHAAEIFAEVSLSESTGVRFFAGKGVGTVTRAGLAIAVGEPAINPVPRQMISQHLTALGHKANYSGGFDVTIGIVDGEKLAEKTMNGRLGIVGGLSILGTTGIVKPFSCSAYIASIHQSIDVAKANGIKHIAASTGRTSERAVKDLYGLPDMALVEMADFVGAVVKYLKVVSIPNLTLAGGFGKLSKLAKGQLNLHSKDSSIDFDYLAQLASEFSPPTAVLEQIRSANTSSEVLDICEENNIEIANRVCQQALEFVATKLPSTVTVEIIAINKAAQIIGRAGRL